MVLWLARASFACLQLMMVIVGIGVMAAATALAARITIHSV